MEWERCVSGVCHKGRVFVRLDDLRLGSCDWGHVITKEWLMMVKMTGKNGEKW